MRPYRTCRAAAALAIGVACCVLAAAQTAPTPSTAPLAFDVASIHANTSGTLAGGIKPLPQGRGYTATDVTVKLMISLMYKVPMRQIHGDPEWLNDERFDVEARVDGSYSIDDLHTMFQNLLAERFGLKFHREAREGNIYALTVDPSGLKMKANTSPQDFEIPVQGPPAKVTGKRVPMNYLTWWLGQQLQNDARPVVDQTGLTGNYDFTLSFVPLLPPGRTVDDLPTEYHDLPSLFVAVKDQLGLKLTPQKGIVEDFVIDHVERPTSN